MKCTKQTGGRGQYGHVKIHLFPGEPGTGYVFENEITGGSIPKEFIKPIDEGIKEALTRGVLAGYPIDDVRIELYDGSYHEVDSSEMAFKIRRIDGVPGRGEKPSPCCSSRSCTNWRFEGAAERRERGRWRRGRSPRRRARIQAHEPRGGTMIVHALVPLAEMLELRRRFARGRRRGPLPRSR